MEDDLNGATSFSDVDLEAPKSEFGKYLDQICPYYMSYGMTWDEFWNESIDRFATYWQKEQYEIERRNQELWMQGAYIKLAIASAFNKKNKYPEKALRITELSDMEKEAENKHKVEELRQMLMSHKRRWKERQKGADAD